MYIYIVVSYVLMSLFWIFLSKPIMEYTGYDVLPTEQKNKIVFGIWLLSPIAFFIGLVAIVLMVKAVRSKQKEIGRRLTEEEFDEVAGNKINEIVDGVVNNDDE